MFLFFIVSFPQATCPVCCDVIFILHHPIFRSVISVCFRRVNRKVRLNAEINTMSGLCDCIIKYSIKRVSNDFGNFQQVLQYIAGDTVVPVVIT